MSSPQPSPAVHTSVFEAVSARWAEHKAAGRLTSVSALCREARISRTTWYSLKDPTRRPARDTVTALADVLGMDADALLRLAGFGRVSADSSLTSPPDGGATGR